jgi:hypothetical protein
MTKHKTPAATGVCQCVKPCLACKCKPFTTSPETQTIQNSVQLSPVEKKSLQDILWRLVALGPEPEDWDTVAIGYINSVLTAYDPRQEGGNHDR